jgi:hypothetical protein
MGEGTPNPQINVSKIVAGGGMAGALFAIISTAIFLIGIPILRYFLPAALVLGCIVAIVIHFKQHETPGKPWILATTKKADSGTKDTPADAFSRRTLIPSVNLS